MNNIVFVSFKCHSSLRYDNIFLEIIEVTQCISKLSYNSKINFLFLIFEVVNLENDKYKLSQIYL